MGGAFLEGVIVSSVLTIPAVLCTAVAVAGGFLRRRARRFKNYIRTMGQRDFYSIEGLGKAVKKNEKFVIKDLRKIFSPCTGCSLNSWYVCTSFSVVGR